MSWKRIALASILTVGLNGATYAGGTLTPPAVPTDIEVPAGSKLILVGHAIGTQNYICAPAATSTGLDWFFIGPQATLFASDGQQIATHFLSPNPEEQGTPRPTWQDAHDGSAVWGKVFGLPLTDPSYVAPGAVPWLLLEAAGTAVGPIGGEVLAKTTFIHRVNTQGGVAPAGACTVGAVALVPYSTDYFFYRAEK